jgi:hypothetical protein
VVGGSQNTEWDLLECGIGGFGLVSSNNRRRGWLQ